MYKNTQWKDHAVSPSNTCRMRDNGDGTYTLTPAGTVIQQGTNMNAANFNNMESGIAAANTAALVALNEVRLANQKGSKHDSDLAAVNSRIDTVNQQVNDRINELDVGTALSFAEQARETRYVHLTGLEASRVARLAYEKAESIEGFILETELTNTQKYPFNNSKKTVAIPSTATRVSKDYTVTVEVESYSGGCVGSIDITDKMLNGFKVAHTGSAKNVKLKIYVQGGG